MAAVQPILYICICIAAVTQANPTPERRKITFSTATSIDYSKIKYDETELSPGTPEYYESNRWVAVNNEGMEYTGTLEEVMRIMEWPGTEEDEGDDDPVGKPHPTSATMEGDVPGQEPSSFNTLKQAMSDIQHNSAEKRSVIGTDERQKVTPNRFPYNAIGRVAIGCTGTFIAPRTVLTSGHCVHQGSGGQWYTNINVQRQKDCDPNQGIDNVWNWAVTFYGWTQSTLVDYDIAIITVYQASPAVMVFDSAATIPLEIVNIAGYPGDKPGWCLWRSYCTLSSVSDSRLFYQCDTAGGMSGSGVYKYWSNTNTRIIYGVHGYGGSTYNKATRITAYYESKIRSWISQYSGN